MIRARVSYGSAAGPLEIYSERPLSAESGQSKTMCDGLYPPQSRR